MADVFLSYNNEDRARAAQVAALLESAGWSVWWDRRIPAGRTWRKVLEDALLQTRCVVVLWSQHSVASTWVAEEVEEARRLEKMLFPVLIDAVAPPIGFRAIQAADLTRWDGSAEHPSARVLIADLKSLLGSGIERKERTSELITPRESMAQKFSRWLELHWPKAALGCAALVALMLIGLYKSSDPETTPPVDVKVEEPAAVPRLTRLAVSGQRSRIKPSETVKLSLKGQYSDGSQSDLRSGVEWLSSDTAVAVVDEHGEVTGLKAGTAKIIAKVGGVESSEWKLGVESPEPPIKAETQPRLVALEIASSRKDLLADERITLRARGIYSDHSEKSLSSGVEWRSSDQAVASLNQRGELIARRPGRVEVVARADKISSPPQTFVIKESLKESPKEPGVRTYPTLPSEPAPAKKPVPSEPTGPRVAMHVNRAQSYREQGNYAAALAELEKAKSIDALNEDVRKEIEQTKRACNAEKVLGNPVQC
jgi:hypothetical protein